MKSESDDLNILKKIAPLMTRETSVPDFLQKVFVLIRERLPFISSAAFSLMDEKAGKPDLISTVHLPERLEAALREASLKLLEEMGGKGDPEGGGFFAENIADAPWIPEEQRKIFREEKIQFYGAVPLRSQEKTLGCCLFWARQPGNLSPYEKSWLTAIGAQAGLAIEMSRLQEVCIRKEKEALALFKLSQETAFSLSVDTVVNTILDHVTDITQAQMIWITLFNPDHQVLEVVAVKGSSGQGAFRERIVRSGKEMVSQVFRTGKTIFVPRLGLDLSLPAGEELNHSEPVSLVAIPLIVKGKAIGAMALSSPSWVKGGDIPQDFLDFLSAIASQAALAIDSTKLYQDLEQKVRELKRLQGHLIQTEKLSAIGELVSGVAHEINNPLTSVIGFTQLLLDTAVNPRDREYLEKIFSEAMSCSEIIRNLLTFARRHPAKKTFGDINEIISKSLELKIYQLQSDGVEVVENLADDIPAAWFDSHQLQQVFFNIINNAHQALLEKKRRHAEVLKLTITSEVRKNIVSVSVQDTGIGIPPDVLPKVFEPFFTTKEVGVGTGLGLSISYGIVKEHGGEILVESQAGEGATFIVTLPINGQIQEKKVAQSEKGTSPFVGKKILIVDESASMFEMCAYILRPEGFQVECIGNSKEALEHLQTSRYDLILIDLHMSGLDGIAFYSRSVQEHPELANKFIFSAIQEPDRSIQDFLDEKKIDLLRKPFSMIALKEAIYRSLTASLNA